MVIPLKTLKNGFSMPAFGIGTWQMGGKKIRDATYNDQEDIATIKHAIDLGVTHIDTAENYAEGFAEIIVGNAIKEYKREKLFLVSKVASQHLHYSDLIYSATQTLKRLQTTYLDLYLIHAPNPDVPIQETMQAMDFLKKEGMIKNIGVSNFTVDRLKAAQNSTENKIVANQLHYNLQYREAEGEGLVRYSQQEDIMLIAWRPLQKGLLLENIPPVLEKTAHKYNKTPAQIAINWLLSQDNVVTVAKTSNSNHLKENLGAVGFEMEKSDIDLLMKDYPNQKFISDAVPLI